MRRRPKSSRQHSGLFYAREARGMSRSELVRLSGVSKQQLSRLENSQIRLRLDHLVPFAEPLGYTPEQMLLWGRYPGTEAGADARAQSSDAQPVVRVAELDTRSGGGAARELRRDGHHKDALKTESWSFPASFVRDRLQSSPERLLVLEAIGDSMAPTIASGERVIVDTSHKTPTPDGLYAIRDTFDSIVIRRLQAVRSAHPARVKIIADNTRHPSDEAPLDELDIVGKVLCGLKLF